MRQHRSRHETLREGAMLGVAVGSATWVWVAVVDLVLGPPFRTFAVLGGVVVFTTVHYLLNLTYGIALVSVVRASRTAPSVFIGVVFGLVMMQIAFVMLTTFLSQVGLGPRAWILIFGGSLLGTAIALVFLNRRYPLAERLRLAEADR